jgi:uncharacterized membrane protein YphA (DoxX/SURF4 family)
MFATFPDQWPGAGLLLLRAAVGIGFIVEGVACVASGRELSVAIAVLMIIVGSSLLIGGLGRVTAIAAAILGLLSLFSWFPGPRIGLFESSMTATLAVVIAAALICLGPGAFSLDARLFGRREVIIPRKPPNHQS